MNKNHIISILILSNISFALYLFNAEPKNNLSIKKTTANTEPKIVNCNENKEGVNSNRVCKVYTDEYQKFLDGFIEECDKKITLKLKENNTNKKVKKEVEQKTDPDNLYKNNSTNLDYIEKLRNNKEINHNDKEKLKYKILKSKNNDIEDNVFFLESIDAYSVHSEPQELIDLTRELLTDSRDEFMMLNSIMMLAQYTDPLEMSKDSIYEILFNSNSFLSLPAEEQESARKEYIEHFSQLFEDREHFYDKDRNETWIEWNKK